MRAQDPFHAGERLVQERAGEANAARRTGVIIGSSVPTGAIPFLGEQRTVAVGGQDEHGAAWASLLVGRPGFASTEDGRTVVLDRTGLGVLSGDPMWRALRAGAFVGLLAIDFATRRRLRINGVVSTADARRIEVSVRESFANCRKYVQRRELQDGDAARQIPSGRPVRGTALDVARRRLVERADTFFVTSIHPVRGVDVSHRGGVPGFVRIVAPDRLRIPDYAGNSMFNTLGNLAIDDRAGLVFVDFAGNRQLQMTGTARVTFDEAEDPRQPTGGTGRHWYFDVACWVESPIPAHVVWSGPEPSPHNPQAKESS